MNARSSADDPEEGPATDVWENYLQDREKGTVPMACFGAAGTGKSVVARRPPNL